MTDTKTQTVLFIDANHQEIRMVQIPAGDNSEYLREMVGGYLEIGCRLPRDHVLFVDEDGLHKPQKWFFRLADIETPFAGNGVIVAAEHYDSEGEYLGTDSVEMPWLFAVRDTVRFMTRAQADAWAKANASDIEMAVVDMNTGKVEVIARRGQVWGDMPRPEEE